MAFILPIEEPWTSQPQVAVGIDWGNPITRGLVFAWSAGATRYQAVPATPTQLASGVKPGVGGISPDFNGASVATRYNVSMLGGNPDEATMFSWATTQQTASEARMIGFWTNGAFNPLFSIEQRPNPQGWTAQWRDNAAVVVNVSQNAALSVGDTKKICGVFRSGSGRKELFIDGALAAFDTTTLGTFGTLNQSSIGCLDRGSPGQYWSGAIYCAFVWNRALSASEVDQISDNPWQIFAP